MGVDSRWVCHTCKTMCYARGARSILYPHVTIRDIKEFLTLAPRITDGFYVSGWDSLLRHLEDFLEWAGRHGGHEIRVSHDHAISSDDLPDYRRESIEGVVGSMTFGEELDLEYAGALVSPQPSQGKEE